MIALCIQVFPLRLSVTFWRGVIVSAELEQVSEYLQGMPRATQQKCGILSTSMEQNDASIEPLNQ